MKLSPPEYYSYPWPLRPSDLQSLSYVCSKLARHILRLSGSSSIPRMAVLTCASCKALLHIRFRSRLSLLASFRSRSQIRHVYKYALPSPELAYHWDTVPPTPSQLESATEFFKTHPPRKLWTATEWRNQKHPDASRSKDLGTQLVPEIVFLGRSNVGKSSLLNALFEDPDLNRVGKRPGKTTMMHAWGLSASDSVTGGAGPRGEMDVRLAVIDMPGYGFGSRDEWGDEVVTYLKQRKQLRRAFVLIDGLHGIKKGDERMIKLLRSKGISHQLVVSKADRILATSKRGGHLRLKAFLEYMRKMLVQPEWYQGLGGLGEVLAVGGLAHEKQPKKAKQRGVLGVDRVRWAVLVAAGLEEWATGKTTTTIPDGTETVEKASTNAAEEASASVAPDSWRPVFKVLDPPKYTPQSTSAKGRMQHPVPFPAPSYLSNSIGDYKSPTPLSFLTRQQNRSPKSNHPSSSSPPSSTPSSYPSSHSDKSYNPVGGLAELESFSSSSRNRSSPIRSKPASPTKGRALDHPKQKKGRGAGTRDENRRQISANLQPRIERKGEKDASEMERGAKLMGERSGSIRSSSGGSGNSSMGSRSSWMVDGVGVGGMADLLSTSRRGRGRGDRARRETAKEISRRGSMSTTPTSTTTTTTTTKKKGRGTPSWMVRGSQSKLRR
jgi:GTP-binding protein